MSKGVLMRKVEKVLVNNEILQKTGFNTYSNYKYGSIKLSGDKFIAYGQELSLKNFLFGMFVLKPDEELIELLESIGMRAEPTKYAPVTIRQSIGSKLDENTILGYRITSI